MAMSQSLNFTSKAKLLKGSVDQGRSSQFKVEKWTKLGSRNRDLYTQVCGELPN